MFQIAIDGPAGSGKSTVSKILADKLNFVYLSTGKFYRAYAYIIHKNNINLETFLKNINSYNISISNNNVFVDGVDISDVIMSEEIGAIASSIATNKLIRKHAVYLQQKYSEKLNVVMDGRDIGTVVLPNAQLKIFLTANLKVRAMRRIKELNLDLTKLDQIEKEIKNRDLQDSNRESSPLIKAKDAIEIDTTYLSIIDVVDKIIFFYKKRIESI